MIFNLTKVFMLVNHHADLLCDIIDHKVALTDCSDHKAHREVVDTSFDIQVVILLFYYLFHFYLFVFLLFCVRV